MNQIISDFFQVGKLRILARVIMGLRGLIIITSLTPFGLGEYTIWLLYYFYFSMLDLGVQHAMERDIPHYSGKKDYVKIQETRNVGWTAYFLLTSSASLLLIVTSFIFIADLKLSILVGLYLFFDRVFRSYEVHSRILFRYKDNEISQNILAGSSLIIVFFMIPIFGVPGVFISLILSSILGTIYLARKAPLSFQWVSNFKKIFRYIQSAAPLAVIIYSIQFFHVVALTILALQLDKETLGYFAFAFRIFQIFVAIFPCLVQDVFRARMYYKIAKTDNLRERLQYMAYPLVIYCCVTAMLLVGIYWWSDWVVFRFAPLYRSSIWTIKLLTLALLPLGVAMVCSDYLCSRGFNKTRFVVFSWGVGFIMQACWIFSVQLTPAGIMNVVPWIYLASLLLVYILIVGQSFQISGQNPLRILHFFVPLGCVCVCVYMVQGIFLWKPSVDFLSNVIPFVTSMMLSASAILILVGLARKKEREFLLGKV